MWIDLNLDLNLKLFNLFFLKGLYFYGETRATSSLPALFLNPFLVVVKELQAISIWDQMIYTNYTQEFPWDG